MANSKTDPNLKTPPTTPGLLIPSGNQNYAASSFDIGAGFGVWQRRSITVKEESKGSRYELYAG
ncbi:Vacuolar-sorting protein SNF7 [Hypoxylon texense]